MNKHLNYGISAVALALAFAATPAAAFDGVDWNWDATMREHVKINFDISSDPFIPTGLTQVEQMQVSAGNIYAGTNQNYTSFEPALPGDDKDHGGKDFGRFDLKDDHHEPKTGPLTATIDLGRLEGNATAAANMASIQSDVGVYSHDTQIAFGGFDKIDDKTDVFQALGAALASSAVVGSGNRGTDALAVAAIAAQFGLIEQGSVTSYAEAKHVKNAQLSLNSTAAGNLHTITNGPAEDIGGTVQASFKGQDGGKDVVVPQLSNSIVIADLNQFNLMNVTATADAHGLTVSGYSGLGKLADQYGTPTAVSSVNASAFGNLSTVTNRVGGLAPLPYNSAK
ncbi:MAG: hypothetical protein ACM3Q1_10800 [Bacteroidales bacterium]